MPLYACERCGFTSAAFRPAAAAAHRSECPECDGVIRILFRSDNRYPGVPQEAPVATRPPATSSDDASRLRVAPGVVFATRDDLDGDGALRLTILGDLDLVAAERLTERLAELKAAGQRVRLDLSQLAFIDSTGVQALLVALTDARRTGWPLEVARDVSPTVEQVAQIVGIAQVLWPQEPGPHAGSPAIEA